MTVTQTGMERLGEVRPIGEFVSCPLNPRKTFNEAKLRELADSAKAVGIIENLVVRPKGDKLEIIAGERRWRAGKMAGLTGLPCTIRDLTDLQALEIMVIENGQREDVHPLEEADGFLSMMKADRAYTSEAIALKIGMSKRYVQQRLQLATLDEKVKAAFREGKITAGHADLICRLAPADQARALKACFDHLLADDFDGCISVRELNRWINDNVRLEPTKDNPQTALFPDLEKALEKPEEAAKILQIVDGYSSGYNKKALTGALDKSLYRAVRGKGDACKFAQRAVVVLGEDRGKIFDVCTARTECKTHWKWEIEQAQPRKSPAASPKPRTETSTAEKSAHQKQLAAAAKANEKRKREQAVAERRNEALTLASVALRKLKIKTAGPAVFAFLKTVMYERPKTWGELLADLADDNLTGFSDGDWKQAVAVLKPLGIQLEAIVEELAAAADEAKAKAMRAAGATVKKVDTKTAGKATKKTPAKKAPAKRRKGKK